MGNSKREQWLKEFAALLSKNKQEDNIIQADGVIDKCGIDWSYIPDSPQQRTIESKADIIYMGGGAGGSKSETLIGIALKYQHTSVIYRREYPQLISLIRRAREIVGDKGRYNSQEKVLRLNDGRILEFASCQYEDDKEKQQGRQRDFIGIDECAHFSDSMVRYLTTWCRTTIPGLRTRVIFTGNPPALGQQRWVVDMFAPWLDPTDALYGTVKPGELLWFASIDGKEVYVDDGEPFRHKGELIQPRSKTHIPARVSDNPYLYNTGYLATLQALPEPLRSQLLYGDHGADSDDAEQQLFSSKSVLAGVIRGRDISIGSLPIVCAGLDVSRGGKDSSILTLIRGTEGNYIAEQHEWEGHTITSGVDLACKALKIVPRGVPLVVDAVGVGSAVVDALYQMGFDNVIAFNGGESSSEYDRSGRVGFTNLKAQAFWRLREALDLDLGATLALPDDKKLVEQLCSIWYEIRTWKIACEPKPKHIQRTGHSPDKADSLSMAIYGLTSQPAFIQSIATWSV